MAVRGYLLLAGAVLVVMAAVLAVYPVSPRGIDTCGSVVAPGPGSVYPTGIHRFDVNPAAECNDARSDRGLLALLVGLGGGGLLAAGVMAGRRAGTGEPSPRP